MDTPEQGRESKPCELSDIAAHYGLTPEQLLEEHRLRSIGPDARMQELIGKARADLAALHPDEWNFGAVTDPAELAACCYWEYARESVSIRKIRAQFEHSPTALGPDVERVLSTGALAKMFFMYPESPFQYGARAFPYPWQSLPPRRRQELAKIAVSKPTAFKVERSVWVANCLASHARALELQTANRRREQELEFQRVLALAKVDPHAAQRRIEQAKQKRAKHSETARPSIRWSDGTETLIVSINWTHHNLKDLAEEFLKWADSIRPPEMKKPNGQGTNKTRDWRASLKRLAAMRLQSRYKVSQIIGGVSSLPLKECDVILEAKQFRGNTWRNNPQQWSDARTEAEKEFHRLFAFLPRDEKPISWQKNRGKVCPA